jgi:hypothetical protein
MGVETVNTVSGKSWSLPRTRSTSKTWPSQVPVAHACNPSYSAGRDQEDCGSNPAQANSLWNLISKTPITEKDWWNGSRCRPRVQTPVLPKKNHGKASPKEELLGPGAASLPWQLRQVTDRVEADQRCSTYACEGCKHSQETMNSPLHLRDLPGNLANWGSKTFKKISSALNTLLKNIE